MRKILLRGETYTGETVTVTLVLARTCDACRGSGTRMHPGWVEFFDRYRHTGLPAADIIRTYAPHYWGDVDPPPGEVPCEACGGTGERATDEARTLAEVIGGLVERRGGVNG